MATRKTKPQTIEDLTVEHVKLLKQLDKLSRPAFKVILELLQDEALDKELKAELAMKIIDAHAELLDKKVKTELTALITNEKLKIEQQKLTLAKQPKLVEGEDEDTPRALFVPGVIQNVSGEAIATGQGVVDMADVKGL